VLAHQTPTLTYPQLYHAARALEKAGNVRVERVDGLIWLRADPQKPVDLKKPPHFSNKPTQPPSIFAIPRKAHPLRRDAVVASMDGWKWNINDIAENFEMYLEDVANKSVILRYRDVPTTLAAMPARNRFNDPKTAARNLANYETAWEHASKYHTKAVFLTLTTDPKRHKSWWHGARNLTKAWNRFLSFCQSKRMLGRRPQYIAVYEFGSKGTYKIPHVHAVLFVPYLMPHEEITRAWERCGQGSINWIVAVKQKRNRWDWDGKPQHASEDESPQHYLAKYLKKALFASKDEVHGSGTLGLYWVANRHFFSCSRAFSKHFQKPLPSLGLWEYVGCYTPLNMPLWVWELLHPPKVQTFISKPPPV